jgi:hypothetical protein
MTRRPTSSPLAKRSGVPPPAERRALIAELVQQLEAFGAHEIDVIPAEVLRALKYVPGWTTSAPLAGRWVVDAPGHPGLRLTHDGLIALLRGSWLDDARKELT